MKQKIVHFVKHPLFTGSAVMIIGTNANNVINYIFHVFMGRMLGPAGYGEMASLFSLIVLIGTIPSSLNLAIVKFVSGTKDKTKLSQLIGWFFSRSLLLGMFIFIFCLLFSGKLAEFLNLSSSLPLVLLSFAFLFLLPSIVLKSTLQGLMKFNSLIFSLISENGLKLLLAILFVTWGLSVSGSILGILIASILGLGLAIIFIKRFPIWPSSNTVSLLSFSKYSLPILIYSLASTSLFTTDLLLIKHFFTSSIAGTYAAMSTLGKIIIFGAGPVSGVMFPIVSKRISQGQNYRKVFWAGLMLTLAICTSVLLFFLLFPAFSISLLYGHQYLQATQLLFPFGVFVTLFSLSTFLIGFYLSINITKIVIVPVIASLLQIVGICLFHNSLQTVIFVSIFTCLSMLITLTIPFFVKIAKISP
jgi:O-antigen/teichoic acid export membrane protein